MLNHSVELTYGLLAASATMAGGLWVANQPDSRLTAQRLRAVMAMGAGFLLALVLLEMLPASLETAGAEAHGVLSVVLLGVATVFGFDRWIAPRLTFWDPAPGHTHADHGCNHVVLAHGAACSAIGCLVVCTFFDGVALAAAFAAGSTLGALVLVGLLLHMIPEGLLAATVARAAGGTRGMARRAAIATGLALLAGVVAPMLLGPLTAHALPFASGILLYVTLGQLVPAAAGSTLIVAGGALFWLLSQLLPHAH